MSVTNIDTARIDYCLSFYQCACTKLTKGISDPKEFARVEAIRDASLCAIALEANLITAIGSGKLDRDDWQRTIYWINQYQLADQELELQQEFPLLAQLGR